MINIALIIISIIMVIMIVVASGFIIVYFQSPEDKNTAWVPKIVTLIGLSMVSIHVLMLPFDISNTSSGGEIPVYGFWIAIYSIIAALSLLVIPFTFFYYESVNLDKKSNFHQLRVAAAYESVFVIIFLIIAIVTYFLLGTAYIPVTDINSPLQELGYDLYNGTCQVYANNTEVDPSSPSTSASSSSDPCLYDVNATVLTYKFDRPIDKITRCFQCTADASFYEIQVSFFLYCISMLALIGVFIFACFGGCGLAALPIDLIQSFMNRPHRMGKEEYEKERNKIGEWASELITIGEELRGKLLSTGGRPRNRKDRTKFHEFRNATFLLEENLDHLRACRGEDGPEKLIARIAWAWTQLALGILGTIISLLWLIHLFLFVGLKPTIDPFLNAFFIALDNVFGLFGTLAYCMFAFYMLWCVQKGVMKIGLRVPGLIEIYPLKVGETLMNAFLFNTELLLLSSFAVVQFCVQSFSLYARFTAVEAIWNLGMKYIRGLQYIWRFYFWALPILAFFTFIYLMVFPKDKNANDSFKNQLPKALRGRK